MTNLSNKLTRIYGDECEKNVVGIIIYENNGKYFFDEEFKHIMNNEEVEALLLRGAVIDRGGKYYKPSSFNDERVSFSDAVINPEDIEVDLSAYATKEDLNEKQDILVSGTNIKTINGIDILGSGDITIEAGGSFTDKKPYTRLTRFTINVECSQPNTTTFGAVSLSTKPYATKIYADNCVLYLPTTYTQTGTPTKLIIFCKAGGSQITDSSDPILSMKIFNYMLYLGYAVLAVDGMPDGLTSELKLDDTRVVGNYVAVRATNLAYEYVVNNYNIEENGCFVFGFSQGGHYAQNVVDLTTIPILAVAEISPVCSMQYHQWDLPASKTIDGVSFTHAARLNVARIFGFPAVTSDAELTALTFDDMRVCGFDPWSRNVRNIYKDFVKSGDLWELPSNVTLNDITMRKETRAPLKIWCAENDTALGVDVMKVFIKAIKNSGQVADIRVYSSGGHVLHNSQDGFDTFVENGTSHPLTPVAFEIAQWFSAFGGYMPTTSASLDNKPTVYTPDITLSYEEVNAEIDTSELQEKLVSGVNIKTINGESLLGAGNITIEGNMEVDDSIPRTLYLQNKMCSIVSGENFYVGVTLNNRLTSASSTEETGIFVKSGYSITLSGISGLRMDYIYATNAGPASSSKTPWGAVGAASNFVTTNYFPFNTDGALDSVTVTNEHGDDYYFFFVFAAPNKSDNISASDYNITYIITKA